MAVTSEEVWQQYATQLLQLVDSGQFDSTHQVAAFAGMTLAVDLGDTNSGIINDTVYHIGNTIPAWNPAYAPQSDLISTYATFLDCINLGGDINPNLQSQINIAADALTKAQTNFTNVQGQAIAGWTQYKAIAPNVTFPAYVQSQYPVYLQARTALSGAESTYQKLLVQAYGAGFATIADARDRVSFTGGARDITLQTPYNMPITTGAIAPAGATPVLPGQTAPAPDATLLSSFAPAYSINGFATVYQEWQTKSANNQVDVGPIVVTYTSSASQWSDFGWSASLSASYFGDFFSVFGSGSASGSSVTSNWQASNYSMKVSFTGLQSFVINPGEWFEPGIVADYKNSLRSGPQCSSYFGPNGSMALLPYQAVVGFEPKIELQLENQDYASFKSQFQAQASASVGIGPFRIGKASFSTYGGKEDISYHDDTNTIAIGPVKSTMPLLLAVICTKL